VWFAAGEQQLHVGVDAEFAPARTAHPALRLSDLEALEQLAGRLVEAGVRVDWADEAEIPGVLRFFACDPCGNRVELLARVT
jgi:hypothetical protein